ncbi:iron chaperone [Oerskovia jenensis]|uniref:Uncharacterized protein YdhG (YjbR/CyaY superfamily) n=1 Tax=Oerskovia jenensis TaxID=162169 RepID=A0ABS2LC10_9CELL|nr:DUF1801 domain-containing protein [Oerskovia jenensis]MBM7477344.1 uncharacterized protein YdhG (YjbR/CyaY superfamily) [Oerskovia jenensis]
MTGTTKSTSTSKAYEGFSAEERAAMKERAKELKASTNRAEAEKAQLEKIAELSEPDRSMASRIHELVAEHAPSLAPKTWYGMPGWAKDGKILCFFQPAEKFGARYPTFGFNDVAQLDDGTLWPVAFALTELTPENEATIADLVKRAAG